MSKHSNIDLIIHRDGAACMIHSARTENNIALAPSTSQEQLATLLAARTRIEESSKGPAKLTPSELIDIGKLLANVLFAGNVRELYNAASIGKSVQISLCACDAGLKAIPWEFLVWPDLRTAPHEKRSICRLVESTTTKALSPMKLNAGIRIMLVVSQPTDQPSVEWIETKKMLETQIVAYTPVVGLGKMEFKYCEASEAELVRQEVKAFDPHIVHFIGHGQAKALVFTRHQAKASQPISAGMVHNVLASKSTRLIVLSACDTANVGDDITPLVSVAEQVVQAGVPAVVANQMPIALRSVHTFCGALYGELLREGNIDRAVNVGRIAMGVAFDNQRVAAVEWGVPVLYRQPGCSQLFAKGGNA